jgi:hypothetical protein
MINTLAIIAAGAMRGAIARHMAENGARVLTSLEGRSYSGVPMKKPLCPEEASR